MYSALYEMIGENEVNEKLILENVTSFLSPFFATK